MFQILRMGVSRYPFSLEEYHTTQFPQYFPLAMIWNNLNSLADFKHSPLDPLQVDNQTGILSAWSKAHTNVFLRPVSVHRANRTAD